MSKILIVATREFKHTVLTKAFFLGSVVVPVLLVVVSIGAGIFLKPTIPPLQGSLIVVGGNDVYLDQLRESIAPPETSTTTLPSLNTASADEVLEAAVAQSAAIQANERRPDTSKLTIESQPISKVDNIKKAIRDGDAAGLIVISEGTLKPDAEGGGKLSIWVAPEAPPSHLDLLKSSARQSAIDTRLLDLGLSPGIVRTAMARPRTGTIRLGSEGGEKEESDITRMVVPMGFMILLWIVTFTGGNYLMMSTIEEKSTRAMEVLLSAISPTELLAGKILGFAAVSAVMLGMYVIVTAVVITLFAALDLVSVGDIVFAGLFFMFAYLMVAAIMAGIGSAVSDITEAQSLMGPAMVILILPMLLMTVVTEDPNGTIAVVASFIPPVSPFVMVLRISAAPEPLPIVELILAIVWAAACASMMIWAAGRVFRVGVLMQGKPPSLLGMLKWIRYR